MTSLTPEDRRGRRLREEGPPDEDEFFFDVDLWHPGSLQQVQEAKKQLTTIVEKTGGKLTDFRQVADTLLLARVRGLRQTLDHVLNYDRTARVDLPPHLPQPEFSIFDSFTPPDGPLEVSDDMPMACVVDSGVVSGHPLLAGLVVGYNNINSGEPNEVDQVGHGTHVAGIVAYGDIHLCLQANQWVPQVRLLNAKVMRRGPNGFVEFADETRAESQIYEAIRWGVEEHDCRVFNLSLGNSDLIFHGGRQLPWALMLDEIARELDVVIVVSAGNVSNPNVPEVRTADKFQQAVFENLLSQEHALIDPACAANVLTVGSIARTDVPSTRTTVRYPGDRVPLVGAPAECSSPFTRTGYYGDRGNGLHRSIKPELVAYGGNYCLDPTTGTLWRKNEPNLGEPSLNHDFANTGRLLSVACGTSCSAPHVTHVVALVENSLRHGLYQGRRFSANLVRALVVHSAKLDSTTATWCSNGLSESDAEGIKLRTVGYGKPSAEAALFSTDNRVVLVAEDEIHEDHFHLYVLELPESFVQTNGRRSIKVTLAYDPPVRGTRKDYLSRTMWFQMYRGLTSEAIVAAASRSTDGSRPPALPDRNKVKARPPFQPLIWSTVQSAVFEGIHNRKFDYPSGVGAPSTFHILVGCTKRFEADLSDMQRYALVVSLEHTDEQVRIYQEVRQRVSQRVRLRQTM